MYAFVQDVPIKEDVYAKIRTALGPQPPDGLVMHLVLRREDGTLRYVDVWRDKASCDAAFCDRIHPAVFAVFREVGFKPAGEPTRQEMPVVDAWMSKD
jgi:hypothetical protein